MRKITQQDLEIVSCMLMNHISLRSASKVSKIPKSSIYRHFPEIKRQKWNPITIQSTDDELVGEFIGIFAGDGCFYKDANGNYKIYLYFNVREIEYVSELKEVLHRLFGKYPMQTIEKNKIIIKYFSKNIYILIKQHLDWNVTGRKAHSVHLMDRKYSKAFKIGFLRGSLDSDGYFSNNTIMFASSSQKLMQNIHTFLTDLDIPFHYYEYREKRPNRVNMHHITIRKPDRAKFIALINPRERKNVKD